MGMSGVALGVVAIKRASNTSVDLRSAETEAIISSVTVRLALDRACSESIEFRMY